MLVHPWSANNDVISNIDIADEVNHHLCDEVKIILNFFANSLFLSLHRFTALTLNQTIPFLGKNKNSTRVQEGMTELPFICQLLRICYFD